MNNNKDRIHCLMVCFFIVLSFQYLNSTFAPILNDYDAYGSKIAMNEVLLVQSRNENYPPTFFIQFAPYNNTQSSLQCSINHPDTIHSYVYSVAVGKKQNKNQTYFFFNGELINNQSGPFVGVAKFNNTSNMTNNASFTCSTGFSFSVQYLSNYEHQEYYVIGVEPKGYLTYGFSNEFVFVFDVRNTSILDSWNGSITWPDPSFMPNAVDISDNFGIIAGFVQNTTGGFATYSPIIYLINFNSSNNHPIIVDQYAPIATANTWQALLTNYDADTYSAKYDMSVDINEYGGVLVGMQFINRVFLFSVNITNPTKLVFVSRNTNGRSLGNGKSVAWLNNGLAAVLVNVYSLNYQWSSSEFYIYDIQTNGYNSNSTPLSGFPNNNQLLPQNFNPIFLNIISSSSLLALLDYDGNILIFIPTSPGFYPYVQNTGLIPLVTSPSACMPGTYKNRTGINGCTLCPNGTKNSGNSSTQCIECSSDSFCSLGSVDSVPKSTLETTIQAIVYPKSPESIIFDEILIQNMFNIRSGSCLLVSPLFWTIIVASVAILIIIIMELLECFINHPRSRKIRRTLKCVFKHTDLINEGELWIGGLASFAVVVLVSFAYAFSNGYFKQYPIETSSDSNFACDKSIRNAKFDTSVQSLAIPFTHAEQEMADLLNNQQFNLNIDFVNTFINCDVISIQAQFGTIWSTIRWSSCNNSNSVLSLSIPLPYQHISVQVTLAATQTIGALRIGLYGSGHDSERYVLREFNFYQSFSKIGQLLAQNLPINLGITKVINETLPMEGEESNFGGIYIPTFTVDVNSLFLTGDQYVRSALTLTTLTVILSETPYYVKNLQQPIAKQSEIVFHNILFTIVCLELFGLLFLSYKLIFKPLIRLVYPKRSKHNEREAINDKPTKKSAKYKHNIHNGNDQNENNITNYF